MEVKVPDIGDFSDVPVLTVLVSVGDTVAAEDPLIELESDKATMEVPSPAAGKVTEIKVAEGDKVSEGSVIMVLESADGEEDKPSPASEPGPRTAEDSAPKAVEATGSALGFEQVELFLAAAAIDARRLALARRLVAAIADKADHRDGDQREDEQGQL